MEQLPYSTLVPGEVAQCMQAIRWKLLKLSCQNQHVTILHLCMKYESWENYPSYRVRTKVLTKFSCDLDLCTLKCIGAFLSPSCIYIWNVYVENYWSDLWPQNPLTVLHLCMKYESCTLETTQVIVSEPKCWQTDRQADKPDSYRAPA